ncbi:hypothetical protein KJ682_05300 [bacterium]|nr:hypothetical protein [bacterium]
MAHFEHILLGPRPGSPAQEAAIIERSSGVTPEVAAEVLRTLTPWAVLHSRETSHPLVMAFPLSAELEALPGRLHAVVRLTWDPDIRYRCLLVQDGSYHRCARNPFLLLRSLPADLWDAAGRSPRQGEFWVEEGHPPVAPRPTAGEVDLVIEGIQRFLVAGELILPLVQPGSQSDRYLALMIAGLPDPVRKGLKFASLAPAGARGLTLAARQTKAGGVADWPRHLKGFSASMLPEEIQAYLEAVRIQMAAGDFVGLRRVSERQSFQPRNPGALADRNGHWTAEDSRVDDAIIPQAPLGAIFNGPQDSPRTPAPRAAGPAAAARQREPGFPRKGGRPDQGPLNRLRGRTSLHRRKLGKITMASGNRGFGAHLGKAVVSAAVLLGLGFVLVATSWIPLPPWGKPGGPEGNVPAGRRSLLEVVDVAGVYEQIVGETGPLNLGPSLESERGRTRALAILQERAAAPLASQIQRFLELAQDGIQQGRRPDREARRLEALAQQGNVLALELKRLELAWYSLAAGMGWADLGLMSDEAIKARSDSLATFEKRYQADAGRALGTAGLGNSLLKACAQAEGMADLVVMFQAGNWDRSWEERLELAAAKVSPTASTITRAYRNCAFALVRLKAAEREQATLEAAMGEAWDRGAWPGPAVAAILPSVRRQAGIFKAGEAPDLIAGTVELYSLLDDPAGAVVGAAADPGFWNRLISCRAVTFDPGAYAGVLGRIRFEALRPFLESGADPADWPAHLIGPDGPAEIREFHALLTRDPGPDGWRAAAAGLGDPYLVRWAQHLQVRSGEHARNEALEFDRSWVGLRGGIRRLESQAQTGEGWTAAWLDLWSRSQDILARFTFAFADDPVRQAQVTAAAGLAQAMARPLPFRLQAFRLEGVAAEAQGVPLVLELSIHPDGPTLTSGVFTVPVTADPAQVARVSQPLDWAFSLAPDQDLTCRLIGAGGQGEHFEIRWDSLIDGGGGGSLALTRESAAGTLRFDLDPEYRHALDLPDLGLIF